MSIVTLTLGFSKLFCQPLCREFGSAVQISEVLIRNLSRAQFSDVPIRTTEWLGRSLTVHSFFLIVVPKPANKPDRHFERCWAQPKMLAIKGSRASPFT